MTSFLIKIIYTAEMQKSVIKQLYMSKRTFFIEIFGVHLHIHQVSVRLSCVSA